MTPILPLKSTLGKEVTRSLDGSRVTPSNREHGRCRGRHEHDIDSVIKIVKNTIQTREERARNRRSIPWRYNRDWDGTNGWNEKKAR